MPVTSGVPVHGHTGMDMGMYIWCGYIYVFVFSEIIYYTKMCERMGIMSVQIDRCFLLLCVYIINSLDI